MKQKIVLTIETRPIIIEKINQLMSQGICAMRFCWGDYDPLKLKRFKHKELYKPKRALSINMPGPFKGDKQCLIRIPFATPEDGRYFQEGTEFYFSKNSDEIRTKCAIQQYKLKSGLIKTFEIMSIKLVEKLPYKKKALKLLKEIEIAVNSAVEDDHMALI